MSRPSSDKRRRKRSVLEEYLGTSCHYCHKEKELTLDHIVPTARNGWFTLYNLVLSCTDCNRRKADILYYCHCMRCDFARWANEALKHNPNKALRHSPNADGTECVLCYATDVKQLGCKGPLG